MRWRNNYPMILQLEDFFWQDAAQKRILMPSSSQSCKYLQTALIKLCFFRFVPAKKRSSIKLNKLKIEFV